MASVWVAGEDEAEAVARLLCAFRDWWAYEQPSDEQMLASVRRLLEAGEAEFLLAGTRERPLGVCQLRYRYGVWHSAEDCLLEDLYVSDEARGQGLGRALLEAAIAGARERGCARIELDTNEGNERALALYESAGFSAWAGTPGGRNLFLRLRL